MRLCVEREVAFLRFLLSLCVLRFDRIISQNSLWRNSQQASTLALVALIGECPLVEIRLPETSDNTQATVFRGNRKRVDTSVIPLQVTSHLLLPSLSGIESDISGGCLIDIKVIERAFHLLSVS